MMSDKLSNDIRWLSDLIIPNENSHIHSQRTKKPTPHLNQNSILPSTISR